MKEIKLIKDLLLEKYGYLKGKYIYFEPKLKEGWGKPFFELCKDVYYHQKSKNVMIKLRGIDEDGSFIKYPLRFGLHNLNFTDNHIFIITKKELKGMLVLNQL